MICPHCKSRNPAQARFCHQCGQALPRPCKNCGQLNIAAAKFCNQCGQALSEAPDRQTGPAAKTGDRADQIPAGLAAKLPPARSQAQMVGERRVVTILFCDVTGSTAAAEQLDPEDWAEIMNGAFERMIRPVYRYEGTVARLMGDAVLAFFGAPISHEDDPERAVLSGLEIIEGMKTFRQEILRSWKVDFNVRVGINTGLVMVGEIGSDLKMEYTAMGDAINLAARMEQTAQPGSVQISQETYRLVSRLFEFEDLGGMRIKGKTEPVHTYRPLRPRTRPRQTRGLEGVDAPLLGRDRQLANLMEVLSGLAKGVGGVVVLTGEAGLGKSRLLREVESASQRALPQIEWFTTAALSYEAGQPYALFQRLIRSLIGAAPDETRREMREKLQQLVTEGETHEQDLVRRSFESLFGLDSPSREPALQGEAFRGTLYRVMDSLWRRRAEQQPVVLVCDDLHWSDPASLSLLLHLMGLADQAPFLLIAALRPEHGSAGGQFLETTRRDYGERVTEIDLAPLSGQESRELLGSLLSVADLSPDLQARIQAMAEGNPFFLEEVVRTLIDRELVDSQEDGDHLQGAGAQDEIQIPDNLQSLLIARIDRLAEEARRTLQLASVVGRTFYYRLLQQLVMRTPQEDRLDEHLLALQQSDLIREWTRRPELEYAFRHALTQEAAYSTILLRERRKFHASVAETLEKLFPDQLEEMAGTLAGHFFQGRIFERAVEYYMLAGDAAYRLFAAQEAARYYQQALVCGEQTTLDGSQWTHLFTRLGRSYELDSQFERAIDVYQDLEEKSEEISDPNLKLAALAAECIVRATQTPLYDPARARTLAGQAIELARELGDRAAEAKVLWGMLLVEAWGEGDDQQALEYGLRSLELARQIDDKEQIGFTSTNLVNVYWNLNRPQEARKANEQAQAIWTEIGNLPMQADALTMKQSALLISGELKSCVSTAQQGLRLSRSIGNIWNQFTSLSYMAQAQIELGQPGQALETISALIQLIERTGFTAFRNALERTLLNLYVGYGMPEKLGTTPDDLYAGLSKIIPFFRPVTMARVIQAKVALGELERAQQIFNELCADWPLATSALIFVGDLYLAQVDLLIAQERPESALHWASDLVKRLRSLDYGLRLPELLWLQARTQLALGRPDQARETLLEALGESERNGEQRVRWRIYSDLAAIAKRQQDERQARLRLAQARSLVEAILDQLEASEIRADFARLPPVQAVLTGRFPA